MIRIAVLTVVAVLAAACGNVMYLDDPTATREDDGHVTVTVTARCAPQSTCGPYACVEVVWIAEGAQVESDVACTDAALGSDASAPLTVTSMNELPPDGVDKIAAQVGMADSPNQPSSAWKNAIDDGDASWSAASP